MGGVKTADGALKESVAAETLGDSTKHNGCNFELTHV